MSQVVDFQALKQGWAMADVLADYGVVLKRVGRDYLRGRCPLPMHSSAESRESLVVHTGRQIWACHSASCCRARQGRLGGTVLDWVAYMEGCTIWEAALRLRARRVTAVGNGSPRQLLVSKRESPTPAAGLCPLPFCLRLQGWHPYLAQRGISQTTAAQFGVGYYGGRGFLRGRIVFPIQDAGGTLIAYAGRTVNDTEPRYLFPPGFPKSQVLFNLHRAIAGAGSRGVIVVEGFFDCLRVHQAGCRNVVALMGTSLSERQRELLVTHFSPVVMMLDGDAAGQHASQMLRPQCPGWFWADVPAGLQPDQMPGEQVRDIISKMLGPPGT